MSRVQCFEFDDCQTYGSSSSTRYLQNLMTKRTLNKSIRSFSIFLTDKDVKILQAIIPYNSADFLRALRKKKEMISSTLNIANVFNENENFKVDPFNDYETSFKTLFSFVIGMIMTVIFAKKRLHLKELYHYNFKVKNKKNRSRPDFLGYSCNNVKYLLEAKGTTDTKVDKSRIKTAMNQLFKSNSRPNSIHSCTRYAVAASFNKVYDLPGKPSKGKKLYLCIIDPDFQIDLDPCSCIHNLYSKINEKEFKEFKKENNSNFRSKDFFIEGEHLNISLYTPFFEIEREKYTNLNEKKQDIQREFKTFQDNVTEYFHQEKDNHTTLFYNGMKIVY